MAEQTIPLPASNTSTGRGSFRWAWVGTIPAAQRVNNDLSHTPGVYLQAVVVRSDGRFEAGFTNQANTAAGDLSTTVETSGSLEVVHNGVGYLFEMAGQDTGSPYRLAATSAGRALYGAVTARGAARDASITIRDFVPSAPFTGYLGAAEIEAAYLGTTEIKSAYLGTTKL